MHAAFPRWMATLTLSIRNSNERGSFDTYMIRAPSFLKNINPSSPIARIDSTAMRMKTCVLLISDLVIFETLVDFGKRSHCTGSCDSAIEMTWGQYVGTSDVPNHTPTMLPRHYRQTVGSDLDRDVGSKREGISAEASACLIRSFSALSASADLLTCDSSDHIYIYIGSSTNLHPCWAC